MILHNAIHKEEKMKIGRPASQFDVRESVRVLKTAHDDPVEGIISINLRGHQIFEEASSHNRG